MLTTLLIAVALQDPMVMTVRSLGPGLHVVSGFANGNILAVEAPDQVLLVDAQSAKRVGLADSALRTVTTKPVRQVVFTHYHEDHTSGMDHWRALGATAIAHRNVPSQMTKDTIIADWDGWHRTPAQATAMPDQSFTDSMVLSVGTRTVVLLHVPGAHTDGDVMVWIPQEDLLHVGDLVEPGGPPFIDWWAGGSVKGMIAAADVILARSTEQTRIVPGHGDVISRAVVLDHRLMLVTVRDRVSAGIRSGRTLKEIQDSGPAREFEPLLGGPRRAAHFVRVVHYGVSRANPGMSSEHGGPRRYQGAELAVPAPDRTPRPRRATQKSSSTPTPTRRRTTPQSENPIVVMNPGAANQ